MLRLTWSTSWCRERLTFHTVCAVFAALTLSPLRSSAGNFFLRKFYKLSSGSTNLLSFLSTFFLLLVPSISSGSTNLLSLLVPSFFFWFYKPANLLSSSGSTNLLSSSGSANFFFFILSPLRSSAGNLFESSTNFFSSSSRHCTLLPILGVVICYDVIGFIII